MPPIKTTATRKSPHAPLHPFAPGSPGAFPVPLRFVFRSCAGCRSGGAADGGDRLARADQHQRVARHGLGDRARATGPADPGRRAAEGGVGTIDPGPGYRLPGSYQQRPESARTQRTGDDRRGVAEQFTGHQPAVRLHRPIQHRAHRGDVRRQRGVRRPSPTRRTARPTTAVATRY